MATTSDLPLPQPAHPLLDALWGPYVDDVPAVRTFARLADGAITNDHIALRSLAADGPDSGILPAQRIFESHGWEVADDYVFPDVHLRARYLRRDGYPRIFISELMVDALAGGEVQDILRQAGRRLWGEAPPTRDASWFVAPPSPSSNSAAKRPNWHDVETVGAVSQYGAWCLCFGRRVNHFTALVDDVDAWQRRLVEAGEAMKADIEGLPLAQGGVGLRQTATAAASVGVAFDDDVVRQRPYAYFEIAQREGGFDGFLATQARQLFDQTKLPPIER